MKPVILALVSTTALALASTPAAATSIFGSLGNFDAVNDTGKEAHGFEIELEGIHASDVTDTFGGAGRGFPTTVERYGAPTITEYSNGSTFGVKITYRADLSGPAANWVGTPSGVYATPGESCWTGGRNYGPATPCDHFGVGLRANPTKVTYNWLVESTPGSSNLVYAVSNVPAPVWQVTPQAPSPGNPAPPPVVIAQIAAPPADLNAPEPQFGTAIWAKVFTTEVNHQVQLEDLLGGNPVVQAAEQHTEVEWQLLQSDPGNPLAGVLDNGGAGPVGAGAEAVVRRYEFYSFAGQYDPVSNQALFAVGFGDTNPGPGDVGAFIGAQNAALNFLAGAVPEPSTWAQMIAGLAFAGAVLRRRRALARCAPAG